MYQVWINGKDTFLWLHVDFETENEALTYAEVNKHQHNTYAGSIYVTYVIKEIVNE